MTFLFLGGVSHAQKSDNLRSLKAEDFCGFSETQVYVGAEHTRQADYEKIASDAIKKDNQLYGSPFSEDNSNSGCRVHNILLVNIVINGLGQYLYSMDYDVHVYSAHGITPETILGIKSKRPPIDFPNEFSVWHSGRIGLRISEDDFKSYISDVAKQQFEDFLLDWRASHSVK